MKLKELLARKIIVSIITTMTYSVGLFLIPAIKGMEFYVFILLPFVLIYAGVIILIFGSITSILSEILLKKLVKTRRLYVFLYILLHGFFGIIGGLFLALADQGNWPLVTDGGICGLLYAIFEFYIFTQSTSKSNTSN